MNIANDGRQFSSARPFSTGTLLSKLCCMRLSCYVTCYCWTLP
jgi:hypothetical protein